MPYEAIRSGKHVGISAEYIDYIERHSNLNFTLLATSTWGESLERLKKGECEVASLLNRTPGRDKYLNFTAQIFDAANVFVAKDELSYASGYPSLQGRKLGLVNSYRHAEYVAQFYPELDVVLVESETDGLLALDRGDIDVFVGSMLSVTAHIQRFGLRELKIIGLAKPHDSLSMGVVKNRPEVLAELNQVISSMPEKLHVDIFKQWNNVKVIDEIDYRYVWASIGFFVVVLLLFGLRNRYVSRFNRTLMMKNEMLEQLQEELLQKNASLQSLSDHDQLTGLFNRHFMIKRCEDEILRMNRFDQSACFVLFDIDFFKQINDTYGHSAGDSVLVILAELINKQCREIDVCCRWGGEEFLLLCPQTSEAEALALAKRLSAAICQQNFEQVGKLTCSFGLAEYVQNDSFIQWFDKADVALYKAKENGRNQIVPSTS